MVGDVGVLLGNFGEMETPEERLDGAEGEETETDDENGENGDGVVSSKSDSGDNREGSVVARVVSVTMKGLVTSLATLTTRS